MHKTVTVALASLSVGVLSACGPDPVRKEAGVVVDKTICGVESTIVNKPIRPIRSVFLLSSPSVDAPKVVNEKATRVMGEVNYHSISGGEMVLEQCQLGAYSYVAMLSPEWLKGKSGWVLTDDLKKKTNPDDPYEGLVAEWILAGAAKRAPITDGDGREIPEFKGRQAEINDQLVASTKKAVDSGNCPYVESAFFDRHTSTRDSFSFLVDCSGGKRFTLTSRDLASSGALVADGDKALSEPEALSRCKSLVSGRVARPSTTRFNDLIGSSYHKNEVNGNVRYVLDFDSENALGAKIEYKAICIFEPSGHGEVNIQER